MSIPAALVILGQALDLQIEDGDKRARISWPRKHVLCADATRSTLWIIPSPSKRATAEDEAELAPLRTIYRMFTGFDSRNTKRTQVKVGEPRARGRVRAVGYRSDKWTGRSTDYQHDFDHPPKVTQLGEVYRIRGAHLRVTPRGVVG